MGVLTRIRRWGVAIAIAHGVASAVAQVAPPPVPPNPRLAAATEQDEGIKPLVITTEEVPVAYAGLPYHSSIRMEGGEGPYGVFVSGDFPPGLVHQTGFNVVTFSGVPTVPGTFSSQVTVYDVYGARMTHDYTFVVRDISLSTPPPLAVIPDPEAMHINDAESIFFPAVINVSEVFHIDDSLKDLPSAEYVLPEAFHINDQTTVIFAEQYALPEAFHISDATTIRVVLGVTPSTAPTGNVNVAYSQTFTAVGNFGPATLTPSGALPNGMSFTTTAGSVKLSGTPTQDGIYPFTITAQDAVNTVSVPYSLLIIDGTGAVAATLTAPTPGSTFTSTSVTFNWTAPTGATGYLLHVGSTGAGSSNLASSGRITGNTVTFSGLPANGEPIYARLYTYDGTTSVYVDYTYTALTAAAAALTTPTPGSTFTSTTVTFDWTTVAGATKYLLELGTTGAGSSNLYNSGGVTGTSATATTLPGNGETVYARLYTYFGTTSVSADYTYTDVKQSTLTTPTPGSTFTSTNVTFDWTAATGATKYLLHIGSTGAGSSNLYSSGGTTATTTTAMNLPGRGETVYVRLYTYWGTASASTDYTYTDVTQASLTTPAPGSTLTGVNVTFDWTTATGATNYLLHVGSTGVGSSNLASSGQIAGTTVTFSNFPSNGETIYVRLLTYWGTAYAYTDYTYTAITATAATLTTPTPGSTFTSTTVTFDWGAVPGATKYLLYLGTTGVGSSNVYISGGTTGTTATATTLPGNGEKVYAHLITYFGTASVSADFTYTDVTQSVLTTPTPGGTFTSTSVTFDWTVAPSATKYLLHIGSTGAGSSNLGSSGQITGTTITFNNLPNNGETVYVRLYTYFGTASAYTDYTYTAE